MGMPSSAAFATASDRPLTPAFSEAGTSWTNLCAFSNADIIIVIKDARKISHIKTSTQKKKRQRRTESIRITDRQTKGPYRLGMSSKNVYADTLHMVDAVPFSV